MKINKTSVTQQIIDYIGQNIENGKWPVGSKIASEQELAMNLGVSRPSVRIAIRQFIALGILESIRGKGTFVRNVPKSIELFEKPVIAYEERAELDDILEFRMLVEPYAAYMAARNMTEKGIEKLHKYYDMMQNSIDNSEQYFTSDMRFHEIIVEASGNKYVEKYLKYMFSETFESHVHIRMQLGYKPGLYYHKKIMSAIEQHNQDMAYSFMKEHLQMKYNQLPMTLQSTFKDNEEENDVKFSDMGKVKK